NHVARWDGHSWSPLGQGVHTPGDSDTNVSALAIWKNDLVVAGNFSATTEISGTDTFVRNIARWDGSTWHQLGPSASPGLDNTVSAVAVYSETLYAGGWFL